MNNPPSGIEIRPYVESDLTEMPAMYKACFGLQVNESYFHWRYRENPAGPVVASCAVKNGKLCAFYGLLPEIFEIDGTELKAYQSMDTMTHPEFQRMGLFNLTAKATFNFVLEKERGLCLFGIPGHRALPGFVKMGWEHPHDFPLLFQHAKVIRKSATKDGSVIGAPTSDTDWESYFKSRKPMVGIIRRKLSPAYLDWHFFRNPLVRFDTLCLKNGDGMDGFLISRDMGNSRRLICLLDSREPNDRGSIARQLISELASRYPRDWLYAWEPTEKALYTAFREARMIKNPFSKGPFSHRVPLILHHLGIAKPEWSQSSIFDWQAGYQD